MDQVIRCAKCMVRICVNMDEDKSREKLGKNEEKSREKRRGEAEKDESQEKKEKKNEREKFYDIGSVCGSNFFSFMVENITK